MNATVRRGAVVVLLVLSTACGDSVPTSPTGTSPSPSGAPLPSVTPPTSFPPLTGPSRTFIFERANYRVAEYTEKSRFVLYDNGAFALQLGTQLRGSFTTQENGLLYFNFESNLGSWAATGKLEGDSLEVKYNTMMQLDDFEDAFYARMP